MHNAIIMFYCLKAAMYIIIIYTMTKEIIIIKP